MNKWKHKKKTRTNNGNLNEPREEILGASTYYKAQVAAIAFNNAMLCYLHYRTWIRISRIQMPHQPRLFHNELESQQ
jgi:hypothetical protein